MEIDERIIAHRAAEIGISLRTGCFCNPGASYRGGSRRRAVSDEWAEVDKYDIKENVYRGVESFEEFIARTGFDSTSLFIRISFGIASNFRDCYALIQFLHTFQEKTSTTFGLVKTSRKSMCNAN